MQLIQHRHENRTMAPTSAADRTAFHAATDAPKANRIATATSFGQAGRTACTRAKYNATAAASIAPRCNRGGGSRVHASHRALANATVHTGSTARQWRR